MPGRFEALDPSQQLQLLAHYQVDAEDGRISTMLATATVSDIRAIVGSTMETAINRALLAALGQNPGDSPWISGGVRSSSVEPASTQEDRDRRALQKVAGMLTSQSLAARPPGIPDDDPRIGTIYTREY